MNLTDNEGIKNDEILLKFKENLKENLEEINKNYERYFK